MPALSARHSAVYSLAVLGKSARTHADDQEGRDSSQYVYILHLHSPERRLSPGENSKA
jgi:hypothetical protein